jgi:hypothetical protein
MEDVKWLDERLEKLLKGEPLPTEGIMGQVSQVAEMVKEKLGIS